MSPRPTRPERGRVAAETSWALADQLPLLVYVTSAAQPVTVTYVSPRIEAILGHSLAELAGPGRIWELVHPDDRVRAQAEHADALGAGRPVSIQYRLLIPQTHAAARHALAHAQGLIETELRSAGDNPAVIVDEDRILANGNHDMAAIAVALDYARLGLAQAVTIANERVQKLLDRRFSGLPSGLRARDGLAEDGLAVIGHGATALAAETRLLAAPVTLQQPTSGAAEGIEDRVTLAPVAARRLHEMAGHATRLAAIELVCAARRSTSAARPGSWGAAPRPATRPCGR